MSIAIRGGSWKDGFGKLTSSFRRKFGRTEKDDAVGFRCVKAKQ
jgi:formylglycine-generating enzyme required for sulfatase activity